MDQKYFIKYILRLYSFVAILDLCKLPELLKVAVWAVKLDLRTNQPNRSLDRIVMGSLLHTCDYQMDNF